MEAQVVFDSERIKEILPHRYPFLLVDKVVEFEKDKRIVAIKNVTANEEFFNGHFPQRAVMPGVLVMEAMAQAAAILARMSAEMNGDEIVFLVGANNFKWKKTVVPGDTLRIEIEFTRKRQSMWVVSAQAAVDGKIVAAGELSAIVSSIAKGKE